MIETGSLRRAEIYQARLLQEKSIRHGPNKAYARASAAKAVLVWGLIKHRH